MHIGFSILCLGFRGWGLLRPLFTTARDSKVIIVLIAIIVMTAIIVQAMISTILLMIIIVRIMTKIGQSQQ